jgi:hypothetical protein
MSIIAAAVGVVVVLVVALLVFTRSPGDDDTESTEGATGQGSDTTTSVAGGRDLAPPTLEPLQEVPGGFSFRWNDPNDPPAEVATYTVFVDNAEAIPQFFESDREQIVTEVRFPPDRVEPVDLSTSTYCVVVSLQEGGASPDEGSDEPPVPESTSGSDAECIG